MIMNLKEMGMSNREIARELGVSRNTVNRMLKKRIQEKKKRHKGQSLSHTGKRSVYSLMTTIFQLSGYLKKSGRWDIMADTRY